MSVTLTPIIVDHPLASMHDGLNEGKYIHLTINDTGKGIDDATQERMFEPFFSTKPSGEGTGMGLAVVHGIVKGLGGEIFLVSNPGKGTMVSVYFSKIEREAKSEYVEESPIVGGGERIMLVDDERAIASMLQGSLEKIGYSVTATTLPKDALYQFKAEPDAFDVVITDQTMPIMTGVELIREITAIKPDMPVILCTVYSPGTSKKNRKRSWRE